MTEMKMSKSISSVKQNNILLLVLFLIIGMTPSSLSAQETTTTAADDNKPTKYVAELDLDKPKQVFFQGFTVSADLFGPFLYAISDYGNFEAALRLNLKNTYFPVFELGYGLYDATNITTHVGYDTKAPYMRIGADLNLLKNKFQENRLFAGFRYSFSSFNYNVKGPDQTDPVWNETQPFVVPKLTTTAHWLEIVFGVQVKIYGCFHMGWSVRYKKVLGKTKNVYSDPYYIPGYGTTTSGAFWGGTYSLIFDLNWGKKKWKTKVTDVLLNNTPTTPEAQQSDENNLKDNLLNQEQSNITDKSVETANPEEATLTDKHVKQKSNATNDGE